MTREEHGKFKRRGEGLGGKPQGRRKLNCIGKVKATPMWVCPDMCWDAILCIL